MAKRKKAAVETDGVGFGASLGDLLRAQGLVSAAPAADLAAPADPAPAPAPSTTLADLPPVRLRLSTKGRRGKAVTIVDGLDPLAAGLAEVVTQLKRELGVGATIEGDGVILQGDQRERAGAWLRKKGARDVRQA